MRRRFFVENFDGGRAALRGETAQHLGRVLRAAPGQLYELSDGHAVWLARVDGVQRDAIEFSLVEQLPTVEQSLRVTLLLSIIKFDRFEWCLEKAAELGATGIVPLAAERSEKALLAASAKRAHRWEKILLESSQQSRCLRPPSLAAPIRPAEAFAHSWAATKLLLSESREAPLLHDIFPHRDEQANTMGIRSFSSDIPMSKQEGPSASETTVALAIGPEGGWTDAERETACASGFIEVSLGGNILRTETAVIAALAIVNYALGD